MGNLLLSAFEATVWVFGLLGACWPKLNLDLCWFERALRGVSVVALAWQRTVSSSLCIS